MMNVKSCAVVCTHFSGKNVLHPIHARKACPPPSAHWKARSPTAVSGLECLCNLHLETRQCRLRLGCSGNAAFLPLHYFILWWFYDGLREEYPGKDGGKRRGESGCAQLAQVTNASEVQHLLSFELSAISPVTEHQRLRFFVWRLCHCYVGCCVAGLSTSGPTVCTSGKWKYRSECSSSLD